MGQFAIAFLAICCVVFSSFAGDVYVSGYTRKDGTYVQPHYRTAPDGNPYNNYSYPGNYNPHTGKIAPGDPATYLENYYGGKRSRADDDDSAAPVLPPEFEMIEPQAPAAGAVTEIQVALDSLGFMPGNIDGQFGPNTATALQNFQAKKGLTPSGRVDSATLEALISALKQQRVSAPQSPVNSMQSTLPAHSRLNAWGNDWVCDDGFRRVGAGCQAVAIPQNGRLNAWGNDWVCDDGFRRVGAGCQSITIPQNGKLNAWGNDWVCEEGFRRVGPGCQAVSIPPNAKLNAWGNDWVCDYGFRRQGQGCMRVSTN